MKIKPSMKMLYQRAYKKNRSHFFYAWLVYRIYDPHKSKR